MGYPEGYPERLRNSIFAHHVDDTSEPGRLMFVLTRAGDHLKVYVFQYLGSAEGTGDVVEPVNYGSVSDVHYDPTAEDAFLPEDMSWSRDRPRISQPVRDWLDDRDYELADRWNLMRLLSESERFDLESTAL